MNASASSSTASGGISPSPIPAARPRLPSDNPRPAPIGQTQRRPLKVGCETPQRGVCSYYVLTIQGAIEARIGWVGYFECLRRLEGGRAATRQLTHKLRSSERWHRLDCPISRRNTAFADGSLRTGKTGAGFPWHRLQQSRTRSCTNVRFRAARPAGAPGRLWCPRGNAVPGSSRASPIGDVPAEGLRVYFDRWGR
jgi:hypothetical protein